MVCNTFPWHRVALLGRFDGRFLKTCWWICSLGLTSSESCKGLKICFCKAWLGVLQCSGSSQHMYTCKYSRVLLLKYNFDLFCVLISFSCTKRTAFDRPILFFARLFFQMYNYPNGGFQDTGDGSNPAPDIVHPPKLTVRTCQEAFPKGNSSSNFQPQCFWSYVSFREGS